MRERFLMIGYGIEGEGEGEGEVRYVGYLNESVLIYI